MNFSEIKILKRRLDALKAQQAVMAEFAPVVLQSQMCQFPKSQKLVLRVIYDRLLEKSIANLLSSDLGLSDASVQAVEDLKESLLSTFKATDQISIDSVLRELEYYVWLYASLLNLKYSTRRLP